MLLAIGGKRAGGGRRRSYHAVKRRRFAAAAVATAAAKKRARFELRFETMVLLGECEESSLKCRIAADQQAAACRRRAGRRRRGRSRRSSPRTRLARWCFAVAVGCSTVSLSSLPIAAAAARCAVGSESALSCESNQMIVFYCL